MSPTETFDELADRVLPSVHTSAVSDVELVTGAGAEDRRKWEAIIDGSLVEWGRDPESLRDDDIDPPTVEALNVACYVAMRMRDTGQPSPLRVVPDGEGGISFERRTGPLFQSLDVHADGAVYLLTFQDCQLVDRSQLA